MMIGGLVVARAVSDTEEATVLLSDIREQAKAMISVRAA